MNIVPLFLLSADLIYIKVENLSVFLSFIKVFYSISVRFLSTYVYTPSGRETKISAPTPFARGTSGFWA